MWSVWDKKTEINGYSAESVLESFKHLAKEETIYIKTVYGRVTQVEGKSVLASVYAIDPNTPDDEFIAEYERVINESNQNNESEE